MVPYTDLHFESSGSVRAGGIDIPYRVLSESMSLNDGDGAPEATVFSYSYLRCDLTPEEARRRPVLFAFNGGPGSSCLWLHLGFLGPTRVRLENPLLPPITPPYELENNPHCPLDVCDVVLIDPVGTGYARLLQETAAPRYLGVDQDAAAIARFIEAWLTRQDRWDSPRYLLGESYGTMRCGELASALMAGPMSHAGRLGGIPVNGVVLMGSAMLNGMGKEPVEPSALNLPTAAATHWHHHPVPGKTLWEFVEECFDFVQNEYVRALFAGSRLTEGERAGTAQKLSRFTGLPAQYFIENDLRLGEDYLGLCCADRELDAGLYDTRYVAPRQKKLGVHDTVADDPAMGLYTPAFVGAMNGAKKRELGIDAPLSYHPIIFKDINFRWDYQCKRTPMECLRGAMRRNREMRIFFATGCYDAVTTMGYVRYVVSQSGLPMDRVTVKEYESGHMPYLGEESAVRLAADLRGFLQGK